jgi:hypothetical protein
VPRLMDQNVMSCCLKGWSGCCAGRAGGAYTYIPPFKLARMMAEIQDKSSPEAQRMTWDALRKSLNGLINKVRGGVLRGAEGKAG